MFQEADQMHTTAFIDVLIVVHLEIENPPPKTKKENHI